jgi:4-hydroxy-tetrahydrodipicolinate synthase
VFGGQGGIYLIEEYNRGACGNMPAAQAADVLAHIWDMLEAGDQQSARDLFDQLLPLINYERMHGVAAYKEVLYRRGVFATTRSRAPDAWLDEADRAELDAILRTVEPLFTV